MTAPLLFAAVRVAQAAGGSAGTAPGGAGGPGATPNVSPPVTSLVGRVGGTGNPSAVAKSTLGPLQLPHVEYSLLLPVLILVASAVGMLVVASLITPRWRRGLYALWTALTGVATMVAAWHLWGRVVGHTAPAAGTVPKAHALTAVSGAVAVDGFSLFVTITIGAAIVLGALVAESYLASEGLDGPEFYVLAMLAGAGGIIMGSANDLIVLFLGLEILSISLYVLTGFHTRRLTSGEAALKYFVLGAFSSAFFLYGIALVYGATGSTNLTSISGYLAGTVIAHRGVLFAGIAFLLIGLAFKVAAVPFHVWQPDAYQGAPTPVTGYMAAAAKTAGFAALLRVFVSALGAQRTDWQPIVWMIAVASLVVGSVVAIVQSDIKRMLAYSSIAHAGYVLIGLQVATARGVAASLFYLLAYTFMVVGSFAVVTVIGGQGDDRHGLEAYRGLGSKRPVLALAFSVLLIAQAGIPFTTGFFAKFYVIAEVVRRGDGGAYTLAIVAMLAAAVAAFFYLRVIVLMYAPSSSETAAEASAGDGHDVPADSPVRDGGAVGVAVLAPPATAIRVPAPLGVALGVCVAFTIVFGLFPQVMIDFARHATLLF